VDESDRREPSFQDVFCDLSVPTGGRGFSVYQHAAPAELPPAAGGRPVAPLALTEP
jgi:hypothetical protein